MSKFVEANEKIAEKVVEGYKKIENGVVGGYKKIETGAVDGFNRIIECLNKLTQELSGTETLRTDFIANVSHELKTPLAVMGNYATMLQRPGITEEEKNEYAKAISEASRRLAQLITNILKLNKLENQQIFPKHTEFDLSEQLCRCLLQFEDAWERKDLQIETDIQEDVAIRSDEELLSLVWNNLFSNAVKFTPEGGTVSLGLREEGEWVVVTVSDTGCGMKPETGKHIFEKFYQGDTSHASVGSKAMAFSIAIGVIGTLLLGSGMSLIMTDLASKLGLAGGLAMVLGVLLGLVGLVLVALAYPVYDKILKKERARIAPEILRLTDELLN